MFYLPISATIGTCPLSHAAAIPMPLEYWVDPTTVTCASEAARGQPDRREVPPL